MIDPATWAAIEVSERHATGQATDLELRETYLAAEQVVLTTADWEAYVAASRSPSRAAEWVIFKHIDRSQDRPLLLTDLLETLAR